MPHPVVPRHNNARTHKALADCQFLRCRGTVGGDAVGTEESLDTWAETMGWLGRYAAVHTKPGEKPWENSDPAPSTQGDFVNSQTQESGACLPVAPLRERCHRSRRRPAYVIPAQAGLATALHLRRTTLAVGTHACLIHELSLFRKKRVHILPSPNTRPSSLKAKKGINATKTTRPPASNSW